jgi:tRNA 2-selenouridine synthase
LAIDKLNISGFLLKSNSMPLLDVRSPSEFAHAHIPGAFSVPLFSDEERKIIGTAYKQESREKAIRIGIEAFGKKMINIVDMVEKIVSRHQSGREIALHCWRGGMRSAAVAWLLDLYGFKVYLLTGGYKAYRQYVLKQLGEPYPLIILGGYTGSNKTGILKALESRGKKIIDLEGIARHKGSAFGNLEMFDQPGQEHFENLIVHHLSRLPANNEPIWVEGESQRLGFVNIPMPFFITMRNSPLVFLQVPFEKRLELIVKDYGKYDKDKIINGIMRIKKKLGGLETKNAINFLLEEDLPSCFAILLKYYDKLYLKTTHARQAGSEGEISYVESGTTDASENIQKIVSHVTTAAGRN